MMLGCEHHDVRTTITLDDDVADLLRSEVRRSGEPFKQTVNRVLRSGLHKTKLPEAREPFVINPIHAFLPSEWTSGSVQDLLNLLEAPEAE